MEAPKFQFNTYLDYQVLFFVCQVLFQNPEFPVGNKLRVKSEQVRTFAMRSSPHSEVRRATFKALRIQGVSYRHESKATSLKKVNEASEGSIVISNFKML